jgi:hypothetical protein
MPHDRTVRYGTQCVILPKRSHPFALASYSSRFLIGSPIPKLLGPGLGLLYFVDETSEAVRNFPRSNLVVLSEPPPDFGADLDGARFLFDLNVEDRTRLSP